MWKPHGNPRTFPAGCRACGRLSRRMTPPCARRYHGAALPDDVFDVVCVGGGPAGLSLAAALRSSPITSGLRIALVEARPLQPATGAAATAAAFSNRCASLTPATVGFLKAIGAWAHVARDRVQPYGQMRVWDGVTDAAVHFDAGAIVAYMAETAVLTQALLARLDELGGVAVFDNAVVAGITQDEVRLDGLDLRGWPVTRLSGGQRLWARLLVGADGMQSPVRSFAGLASSGWNYQQHGVVATLRFSDGTAGPSHGATSATAFQRFLPTGPVALLPLPSGFSSLVWSTSPATAVALKALRPVDFVAAVNAAFRLRPLDLDYILSLPDGQVAELAWRSQHTPVRTDFPLPLVDSVESGSVASFPLRMSHSASYVSDRVALVGDAAHTIHPLAGQGLNLGQGDVEALLRTIEFAVEHGQDLGSIASLQPYSSERYGYNLAMLRACDLLQKLYSVGSGPIVPLRSLGLMALDMLQPVKQLLMRQVGGSATF